MRATWTGASALLILLLALPAGALSKIPKILGPGPGNPPADGGDNPSVGGIFSTAGNLTCSGSLIQPVRSQYSTALKSLAFSRSRPSLIHTG